MHFNVQKVIGVLKNKCITSNLLNSEMQKATVVMKKKFFSTSFFFYQIEVYSPAALF